MKKLFYLLLAIHFIANLLFSTSDVNAQGVGINSTGNPPDPSATLDVSGVSKGVLINRMTTAQRNAITSPAKGLIIYNTDCDNLNYNAGTPSVPNWVFVNPSVSLPSAPAAANHLPSQTQIIWNWNTVTDASGYKWNTMGNYAGATDNGTITSYSQPGLICNTSYTLYVWAYNICGNSAATTLTQMTSVCPFFCGVTTVTFTYRGNSVTYGTIANSGQCWLDRNLGATQIATAYNDPSAYGDLFQWGRLDDGHQSRASSTIATLSSSDIPANGGKFIVASSSPYNWRSSSNDALWQGVNGINNPCPAGWRLPTDAELDNERATWSSQNYNGAYASPLKWTVSGDRTNNGTLNPTGNFGNCWSSTVAGTNARYRYFDNNLAGMYGDGYRAYGMSVRCIKD